MTRVHSSTVEKLLYSAKEASLALGISERKLWSLTQSGAIRCVRIDRCVRYDPSDLRAAIDTAKTI